MIQTFLKAKHWQLFLVMIGIPMSFYFYFMFNIFSQIETRTQPDPNAVIDMFGFFPLIMTLFSCVFFGWFWSIVMGLQDKMPKDVNMNLKRFKIFFFIPLIYILLLMIAISGMFAGINSDGPSNLPTVFPLAFMLIIPLHLFSIFCMFHSLYFVAKTIKTVELQRETKFEDYAPEFFLLWFYIIGVWIVQPKINRLNEMRIPQSDL